MTQVLDISPQVQAAIEGKDPIVALESTIISHGMPWPKNVETALAVEQAVRDAGAIPATIAIVNGRCKVGLDQKTIEALGSAKDVWKTSIRDIPYVLAQQLHGATTVAATLRIASMAGIRVFVTGGIGGVHRGAETSFDISADLTEMSRSSAAIVSAGVKSILDIGLTLEHLETLGIPVVTIGQDEFPSFYSSKSGHKSPLRLDSFKDIAALMHAKWNMQLEGSILVANPLPAQREIGFETMEGYIKDALHAADAGGIRGKDLTPFLLSHLAQVTEGESLEANIALILHNAVAGARLAIEYASQRKSSF